MNTASRRNRARNASSDLAIRKQRPRFRRSGVMLLEVIVALGLLVFGLSIVALKIDSGLKIAQENRRRTLAMMLVDSKLDEVQAGVIQPDFVEREVKGDFGILYPGYTWRIEINRTEIEGFYLATIQIGYCQEAVQAQIDNPKEEIDIEDSGTLILRTAHRLFPKPADIDLERDFGLSQEDMDGVLADLAGAEGAGGAGGAGGGEGGGGDPQLPGGLSQAEMAALLQSLLSMSNSGSFDPRMLSQLPEEQFMAVAEILESMGMGRGNMSKLKDMYTGSGGGRPPMMRGGEGHRSFRRGGPSDQADGGKGGDQAGSSDEQANAGIDRPGNRPPGAGNRPPGAGNRPPGSGNRPPGAGNRPSASDGSSRQSGRPGGQSGAGGNQGGSSGGQGNSSRGNTPRNNGPRNNTPNAPSPRDPNQPYPSVGH